jgi:hypothetical protein
MSIITNRRNIFKRASLYDIKGMIKDEEYYASGKLHKIAKLNSKTVLI